MGVDELLDGSEGAAADDGGAAASRREGRTPSRGAADADGWITGPPASSLPRAYDGQLPLSTDRTEPAGGNPASHPPR